MLSEIDKALVAQEYIGGGVPVRFERYSLGIRVSYLLLRTYIFFQDSLGGFSGVFVVTLKQLEDLMKICTFGKIYWSLGSQVAKGFDAGRELLKKEDENENTNIPN